MSKKNKVTIKEIAEMSNTSKTTVSFYLNGKTNKMSEDTKKKIQQVIQQTGYKPSIVARSLNYKSSKLLGILIGDITNTFSNQIVKGIEDMASKEGYQIIVGNTNYDDTKEAMYIERMLSMGVDGFIIQPTAKFRKNSRKIQEANKPMVFFDSKIYDSKTSWVKTNNYEATYNATINCIKKGYENYILVTANPSLISTRIERATGFSDALMEYDLTYETLIVEDDTTILEEIIEFFNKYIDVKKKTLVFVPNCWALPMVFIALKEYHAMMPTIGLIGFDNTEWANFSSPTVTTIVQPGFEEGQQASQILINQIENPDVKQGQRVLDCSINWKQSTAL